MEKWEIWFNPKKYNLPARYNFDKLVDEGDNLQIYLFDYDEKIRLKVSFPEAVCYRKFDEGDSLRELYWLQENTEKDFILQSSFFISYESSFLSFFTEESLHIHQDQNIITYVIVTDNEIIEVLSYGPPEFDAPSIEIIS